MAKLYDIRVNDTDYDGEIVIEQFSYYNSAEPYWAVPDWEERGDAELAGPFASRAEAIEAIHRIEEIWSAYD